MAGQQFGARVEAVERFDLVQVPIVKRADDLIQRTLGSMEIIQQAVVIHLAPLEFDAHDPVVPMHGFPLAPDTQAVGRTERSLDPNPIHGQSIARHRRPSAIYDPLRKANLRGSQSMPDDPLMLSVSGLRGIVGTSLTPEVAMRYASAFGGMLADRLDRPRVVIGRDGRAAGGMIHHAAIAGLLSAACDVIDLDIAATPTVALACQQQGVDAGVIVTASHNPGRWNGIKCLIRIDGGAFDGLAHAPDPDTAHAIIGRFETGKAFRPVEAGDLQQDPDAPGVHVARVWQALDEIGCDPERIAARALRTVVDAVNASGSTISMPLCSTLTHAIPLYASLSGLFPHPPEPTIENLAGDAGLLRAVPGLGADVGFAQDPDADRLAIVDETGAYIGEEYTLVIAAEMLLRAYRRENPDGEPVICVNLSTSRMIDDIARRHGARVERTPVGEAHVVRRMRELADAGHAVLLGGEGNGGVIWPRVSLVRDSLAAIALTLALMAEERRPLGTIVADLPRYEIVKRKQPLADRTAAGPAIERLCDAFGAEGRIDTQDGVRIDIDDTWVHVRASNTEPILRLIAEAPDRARAEAMLDRVQTVVEA